MSLNLDHNLFKKKTINNSSDHKAFTMNLHRPHNLHTNTSKATNIDTKESEKKNSNKKILISDVVEPNEESKSINIEHIYVINMKKDEKKLQHFKKEVNNQFEFHIIEGVDPLDEKYKEEFELWREKNNIFMDVDYEKFDWKYYLESYKDLRQNGIHTKQDAWYHWINFGKKELRSCNKNNNIVNKGQWGCLMSHIKVLKDALNNHYERIIILEDDVIFREPWNVILEKIKKINNSKIKLIYLGCSQHSWKNIELQEEGFYYAFDSFGTFAYMVHGDFFPILLNVFKQKRKPVDSYLTDIQKIYRENCIVMFPNIIICDLENSNIGMERNNEAFFKKFKWDIYEDDTR